MRDLVLEHLAAILGSDSFARSARRKAILTYLVERALDNPTAEFSAADISAAVYGRTGDDPDRDTVVRVEMARVRSGLDSWYAGNGWNSPVRISIPKGSYQPVFEFAAKTDPPAEPQPARRPIPKWAPWSLGALVLLAALAAVAWRTIPRRGSEETMLWLPGAMRQPTTSPDGGRIAFVWDGDRGRADIFLNRLGTQRVDRLTDLLQTLGQARIDLGPRLQARDRCGERLELCVPPAPGMIPSVTSVRAKRTPGRA